MPIWLATRSPLTARILIDGAYFRAMFGSTWVLGILGGLGLGIAAAHDTGGTPIPPSLVLTSALLVLAIFDATWGAAGVIGFGIGMLIWRSGELGLAPSVRSFLGLAALWFAIPLIASAARPFRRSILADRKYAWDRFGDAVIATLIAGWATQKTIGGLPGLSGLDLPIAEDANRLAFIAMAAVIVRVLVEEFAAWRYPLRLGAVATGKLPFAGYRSAAVRDRAAHVLVRVPRHRLHRQLLAALGGHRPVRRAPGALDLRAFVPELRAAQPDPAVRDRQGARDAAHRHASSAGSCSRSSTIPTRMLRNGFILMSLPGLALSLIGLFGHDGPDPKWTWPRQMLGGVIVLVTVGLVLTGW